MSNVKSASLFNGFNTLLLSLLLCANANAQDKSARVDIDWYQIEVAIFAFNRPSEHEFWPKDIVLAYPLNWRELSPADSSTAQTDEPDSPATLPAAIEKPFTALSEEEMGLNKAIDRITISREARLLYHAAWRQPVPGVDEAPALVIEGGNTFGDHHELEGSIKISRSRFLHFHTNLWLSEFETNYGQPAGQWPELPEKPSELLARVETNDSWSLHKNSDEFGLGSEMSGLDLDGFSDILKRPYVIKRIVTQMQSRRMKSEELHYIDHPMFGILVRAVPYNPLPAELPQP